MSGTGHSRLCYGGMAQDGKYPDLMTAHAVIERLREEAHELRDLLTEAYFKIALLEETASNASRPSLPTNGSDPLRRH